MRESSAVCKIERLFGKCFGTVVFMKLNWKKMHRKSGESSFVVAIHKNRSVISKDITYSDIVYLSIACMSVLAPYLHNIDT